MSSSPELRPLGFSNSPNLDVVSPPKSDSIPQGPEIIKAIINQINYLVFSLTPENLESHFQQIRLILDTQPSLSPVFDNYYLRLFNLIGIAIDTNNKNLSLAEHLFIRELQFVGENLRYFGLFFSHLTALFEQRPSRPWSAAEFLDKYDCRDLLLQFVTLIKFLPNDDEAVRTIIKQNSFELLSYIRERSFPPDFDWNFVLEIILGTSHFPFINKLLALSSIQVCPEIAAGQRLYKSILKMSFKELIAEIGPENLLPERFLASILVLKPSQVDFSIALVLSEILLPGSQGLNGSFGACAHRVEANAKSAQLQASFRLADQNDTLNIDWANVFNLLESNLADGPTNDSLYELSRIDQVLGAIDFKPHILDMFLSHDWKFSRGIMQSIITANPSEGDYNICELPYAAICFEQETEQLPPPGQRHNPLVLLSVSKLMLSVVADIKLQPLNLSNKVDDMGYSEQLIRVFDNALIQNPEYLMAAAVATPEKSEFILGLTETVFTLIKDGDSSRLDKILQLSLADDSRFVAVKHLQEYQANPTLESISSVINSAKEGGLLDQFMTMMWSRDVRVATTFLVESSLFDYNYQDVVKSVLVDPKQKSEFFVSLLDVLFERAQKDFQRSQQVPPLPLPGYEYYKVMSIPIIHYWLNVLKSGTRLVDSEKMKVLLLMLLTTYPRLINYGAGHDAAILANAESSILFPPNVEVEMKSYYSKMYNKEMAIKNVVDMLVDMKNSDDPHKQDVFACMIHSLLDEYRFFSEYPLSALASTSLLFGALLEKDLIHGTTLTVALNFIWESCNQPHDSHMFKFAVQSLYNFKSRLHEYPIYCKHLLECRSLSAHAKMFQIVKDAANGIPCSSTQTTTTPAPEISHRYQSICGVNSISAFVKQQEPAEAITNKLLFFVNNMTHENMKTAEIGNLLMPQFYDWFANYLVLDRAKSEPNNHDLYGALVSSLEDPVLFDFILSVTLREVQRIVESFKESTTERNQLKNLGAWLGRITLGSNKVLKRDQIALKFLLVEAFDFKTLHLIIPFVCKILDQAKNSRIFRPPNPWSLGIIKVLAELYECGDLKLNLKFEIEVLLNAFKIQVSDVEPSTLIRTHNPSPSALATMFGIHPDGVSLSHDMSRLALEGAEPIVPPGMTQMPTPMNGQSHMHMPPYSLQQQPSLEGHEMHQAKSLGASQQVGDHSVDTSFSTLIGNSIFTQHANLRRVFQAALTRAVRECAVPILTRVSEAVLTTTEALVVKDFATDGDPAKLRNSYQNMAQRLSHIMVFTSGRKLLAETIESAMLQLLSNNPNEFPLGELGAAIQANVGLCVEIVEKIASDNISELIDERMQRHVSVREQHNPAVPFIDERASKYAMSLPEPLGLIPGGLTGGQLRIYEKFGASVTGVRAEASALTEPQTQIAPPLVMPVAHPEVTSDQLFMSFTQSCETAILLLADVHVTKLADLEPDHPFMTALIQALTIAQSNALKHPELLLKAAQYAVNCLFTQPHKNPISNEMYVVILDKLCECSPSTAKDVTWWLVYSSDQRKFNVPVIYLLLEVQLVLSFKLDSSLSRLILESGNPAVVNFSSRLLNKVYLASDARPIALRCEFAYTLDALCNYKPTDASEEVVRAKAARDSLFELLDFTRLKLPTAELVYEQMGYIFAEWVKLITHGEMSRELQDDFVDGLYAAEILTNPEYVTVFFQAATEIAVAIFATEHEIRTRTQHETYLAVDALAVLTVRIISKVENSDDAVDYLEKILSIVVMSLSNDHEMAKQNWNERAYFRYFSSLLSVWSDELVLDANATAELNDRFYPLIADTLHTLQPIVYPGFTFAWVSLIAHRMLMPKLLELPNKIGYAPMVRLLTALLKFQLLYSRNANPDVVTVLFKALNRIFAGLIHDYPEFLVECHYHLSTAVPRSYIQLRNLILSAIPRSVNAPDPFTQGLKVERLPEIGEAPLVAYEPMEDLAKVGLRKPLENFLRIPTQALMRTIDNGMKLSHAREEVGEAGSETVHYNVKLINALVLHVGITAVADRLPSNVRGFNTKSSQVALLVDLMSHGSLEFKFNLINAICNQLRFPSSHTHWFVGIILHFFSSASIWGSDEARLVVQELIIRVLLERRLVYKPHPWGLTIVFTELVKNDDYGFFELPFVKSAGPELRGIFETLALNIKGTSISSEV